MSRQRIFSKGDRLYKRQKLCSQKAIDRLFAASRTSKTSSNPLQTPANQAVSSFLAYPLRAVCMEGKRSSGADIQFFISIPKKRLRHAVDRVTMRRRVRESFRLENTEDPTRRRVDVAFIYVAAELVGSDRIRRSMRRLLAKINQLQTTVDEDVAE